MTQIPARLIRPHAQRSPYNPPLSERRASQRAHILDTARRTFIAVASTRITLPEFALAIDISAGTIRRHICDMAYLTALILNGHLRTILTAIEAIPPETPNLAAARRAEYRCLITDDTDTVRLHVLFVQERILLSPNQRDPIEQRRRALGALLGGPDPEITLTLLDCPGLSLPAIEAMLQAQAAHTASEQTQSPTKPAASTPQNQPQAAALKPPTATPPAGRAALAQSTALHLEPAYPAALLPTTPPPWLSPQAPQQRAAA